MAETFKERFDNVLAAALADMGYLAEISYWGISTDDDAYEALGRDVYETRNRRIDDELRCSECGCAVHVVRAREITRKEFGDTDHSDLDVTYAVGDVVCTSDPDAHPAYTVAYTGGLAGLVNKIDEYAEKLGY